MNERLLDALDEISDRHIYEAATAKKRNTRLLIRAAAAIVAVVLLLGFLGLDQTATATQMLVSPAPVREATWPTQTDYPDDGALKAAKEEYNRRYHLVKDSMAELSPFWDASCREFLSGEENGVWSPVNLYLSLAMLAEISAGDTRQEILDTLGAESMEELRTTVRALWETVTTTFPEATRRLAASVWLDDSLQYHEEAIAALGNAHYASVYRTNLSSPESGDAIRKWISQQTKGMLSPKPMPEANGTRVLELVSTLYLDENWLETFDPADNREGLFHAPGGDTPCTYMNGLKEMDGYARGADYTAVSLSTWGESDLWLILPDEGTTPADLLRQGDYLDTVFHGKGVEKQLIQLTMPKFDLSYDTDLCAGLKNLGIEDAFSLLGGDFSGALSLDTPIRVGAVRQSARIIVDENGVRCSSGTESYLMAAGIREPGRVVVDRPFLFVLTTHGIPLFAGVVTQP